MSSSNFRSVSTDYGDIDCIINTSNKVEYILLLAHGAGAGMTHVFMETLARSLSESIFTVVRYNFIYMQQGKKMPDAPKKAHHVISKVIEDVEDNMPRLPMILSGKSFGGRMSSQYAALHKPNIFGLIFFGFPLHAIGKPSTNRAEHLNEILKPMLFLQGSKDKLAELDLINKVTGNVDEATLSVLENADHSFNISKKSNLSDQTVFQVIVNEMVTWIKRNS